jgi:hypothetical protein
VTLVGACGPQVPVVDEESGEPTGDKAVRALTFSMALLPDRPLTARALDERVGFFSLAYADLGDHRGDKNYTALTAHESDMVDVKVKVINRRRLKSGQAMAPLTYYIDPTVPEEWRGSFKDGVEAWNPAFEAAGFGPKAIRAVLPGDADWPADYNAGDIRWGLVMWPDGASRSSSHDSRRGWVLYRYSSISWTVDLDTTFALGPAIVDPRSGEILDSDIIFTHGWVKYWIQTFEATDVSKDPAGSSSHKHAHSHSYGDHHHDHDHDHEDKTARRRKLKRMGGSLRHHHRRCQVDRMKDDLSPRLLKLAQEASPDGSVSAPTQRCELTDVHVTHVLSSLHMPLRPS